jgi:hypothetical protein
MIKKYVRKVEGSHASHIVPEDLAPDENHQYLQKLSYPEDEWMIYDSWDMVMAIKLITLGSPINLEELAEYAKDMAIDSPGKDLTITMHEVYNRALRIAESSIAMGKIKDPDTPENWITWARSKFYKIDHLDPSKRIHNLEKAWKKTELEVFKEFYQNQIDGWEKLPNRRVFAETETTTDVVKKKNELNHVWQRRLEAMANERIKSGKKSQATKGSLANELAKEINENPATIERNTRRTWKFP